METKNSRRVLLLRLVFSLLAGAGLIVGLVTSRSGGEPQGDTLSAAKSTTQD